MSDFELIDRRDNDCHDTGSEEEMQVEAMVRNADEPADAWPAHRPRWCVRPAGYAEANFREDL